MVVKQQGGIARVRRLISSSWHGKPKLLSNIPEHVPDASEQQGSYTHTHTHFTQSKQMVQLVLRRLAGRAALCLSHTHYIYTTQWINMGSDKNA